MIVYVLFALQQELAFLPQAIVGEAKGVALYHQETPSGDMLQQEYAPVRWDLVLQGFTKLYLP
jgi:hypothetical protein